jgi:hypothetical protein
MDETAAHVEPTRKSNTTTTRALLARAGQFELRMQALEYNQAVMAWLLAEFLYNWRVSIAAAYAARVEHNVDYECSPIRPSVDY